MCASKNCNILIGNDDEFGVLANNYDKGFEIAQELSKEISIVIYKKGEEGSVTFYDNKKINKGIFLVKVLKPTGAGDAFNGAFATALCEEKSIKETLIFANAFAGISTTRIGTANSMPSREAIDKLL